MADMKKSPSGWKNRYKIAGIVLLAAALFAMPVYSQGPARINNRNGIRHVLLVSIDGMHALDYENCVASRTCPNLAALGQTGVNYTRTSTSRPSDSFPGLMALVTGGTPRSVGAFYDVAYDRVLAPPQNATGNGVAGGVCQPGIPNGTTTEYEEGVEIDQTALNGGGPYSPTDGGIKSIDPTRLPRDPFNGCKPVYPWNFIRTNTIYGVIHAAGGFTAWSDKHAVYAAVSGPSNNAANVDDYYSPEVNSNVVALANLTTASGMPCSPIPDNNGGAWTDSFMNIQCYDQLKVNAVLNWIKGLNHLGLSKAPVPAIFGMNFQSVSVGQKLIEKGVKGGYLDAAGKPTMPMLSEIQFADAAIGQMAAELKKQGLLDSTLIIITAKHGQSPVDTNRFFPIPGKSGLNGASPANVLVNADPNLLPFSESPLNPTGIGPTEDDISQLWLTNSSDTLKAVGLLEANAAAAGIGQIFYGPSLETMFNAPGLPAPFGNGGDPRTPDIIVQPNVGVVYTGSSKKQAEHGGFAQDDTNVMILVSNPNVKAKTVTAFVETTQVAPTILEALGLDPNNLDAVQIEGTAVLPGLDFLKGSENEQ
jgi:hypothetical protein